MGVEVPRGKGTKNGVGKSTRTDNGRMEYYLKFKYSIWPAAHLAEAYAQWARE